MNNLSSKYYKHSGKFSPLGIVLMLVFGGIGALISGALYGYIIAYCPFIYINFIITIVYGLIVGFCVTQGAKRGKVRNMKVLTLVSFLVGCFAQYVNWVFWLFATSKQEIFLFMPQDVFAMIQLLNKMGVWSIFGGTPTGFTLYAIWAIEAFMIIGMVTLGPYSTLSEVPFCETSKKWLEDKTSIFPLQAVEDYETLKTEIEQDNFQQLVGLERTDNLKHYSQLDFLQSEANPDFCLMTLSHIQVGIDKDGKEEREENKVMVNFLLPRSIYDTLKNAWA